MSWLICGSDKQGNPFSFEANAVKGSCRATLSTLLEILSGEEPQETLRARGSFARKPGLYQLLWDDGTKISLAGFWIVFGHHYLEDGPFGPPDKVPPYSEDILEALTEEVWWKNYDVYPRTENVWEPILIFEWPNDVANRSNLRPPGLPLPSSEFAQQASDDYGSEFWLERFEDDKKKDESSGPVVKAEKGVWSHLPANRSLITTVVGHMEFTRVRHNGSLGMVPPYQLGNLEDSSIRSYPEWLDGVVEKKWTEEDFLQDENEHFLGQPLELPGGRIAFPMSGWLTKSLQVWPMFPRDVRYAPLPKRDVGSRAIAQFKQAMVISLTVLSAIILLSMAVKKATTPVLEDVAAPKIITPQPALSLCSADHEKFMEEFRCQIKSYALNLDTDQPFCGDKASTDIVPPLALDYADLQALYCGLRDRKIDGWVWGKEGKGGYNFGQLAATKACFNVLGHPWQYQSKDMLKTKDGKALIFPEPEVFLGGNLGINQLSNMITNLDIACDAMKDQMEMQVLGTVVSTFVGTTEVGKEGDRRHEAYDLRRLVAEKTMMGVRKDLKTCFETGLVESPYLAGHYSELCNGELPNYKLKKKEFLAWQKLDRSVEAPADTKTCEELDSALLPSRDSNSCAVLSRYERARFGADEGKDEDSHPDDLWTCHIGLSQKDTGGTSFVRTSWDLKLPIPINYNLSGSGVKEQLALDAGLRVLAEKGTKSKELGECWTVLSTKLARYKPVHPLIADLDAAGWPSEEQQLCGQICASYFRFSQLAPDVASSWVTPKQDIDRCMFKPEPYGIATQPKGRLDRLLIPWNHNYNKRLEYEVERNGEMRTETKACTEDAKSDCWVEPTYEQICAFNLVAQNYMPAGFIVGDLVPPVWAGTAGKTTKIAGDIDGVAAKSAMSLTRYGRTRSRATCGYAAAQCFASLMLEVMGKRENQPSEWNVRFDQLVKTTKQTLPRELEEVNPWCSLVQPYMGSDGILPEGQLDFPCAKGVDDAQQNAEAALVELVTQVGVQ